MAVILVGSAIMGIMMSVAMPVWHQAMQREKEEELIFRGMQYARAVGLYQRKNGNAYPPSLDVLVQQKYLRKKYKDPMTEDGVFQLIPAGAQQPGRSGITLQSGGGSGQQSSRLTIGQQTSQSMQQQGLRPLQTSTTGITTVVTAIAGVVSKSQDQSIRVYNGRNHYNEWFFVYSAPAGRGGVGMPGGRGGRGGQGGPGRGGQGRGRGDMQSMEVTRNPDGSFTLRNPDGSTTIIRGRGPLPPGMVPIDPTQLPPGGGRGRGRGGN